MRKMKILSLLIFLAFSGNLIAEECQNTFTEEQAGKVVSDFRAAQPNLSKERSGIKVNLRKNAVS